MDLGQFPSPIDYDQGVAVIMSIESDNTVSNVLSVSVVRLCCRLFVQLSICVDGRSLLSVRHPALPLSVSVVVHYLVCLSPLPPVVVCLCLCQSKLSLSLLTGSVVICHVSHPSASVPVLRL